MRNEHFNFHKVVYRDIIQRACGEKRLHDFAANLFRKLANYIPNFIRNAQVLYKILQKKQFGLFFVGQSVVTPLTVSRP